jgi:hypothetical protein
MRKRLIIPMHTSYSPDISPALRRKLMTRAGLLARMVENGEIEPWLPLSPEDAEFLESWSSLISSYFIAAGWRFAAPGIWAENAKHTRQAA